MFPLVETKFKVQKELSDIIALLDEPFDTKN